MNVNYLAGGEGPTAARMNELFGALEAKLTTLLGGRSFLLAQTAVMPSYLMGRPFFFTAGTLIYASRVPGYTGRPYDHTQFATAQGLARVQPGYLQAIAVVNGGTGFLLNDVVTLAGGTVAPGGTPASIQVTGRDTRGGILTASIVSRGSYTVLPATPNTPINGGGGHGTGAVFQLDLIQYDLVNQVAPLVPLGAAWSAATTYPAGNCCVAAEGSDWQLYRARIQTANQAPATSPTAWEKMVSQVTPPEPGVGFFEASLAAHSFWRQPPGAKQPAHYYLQDGATIPEKHLRLALAEIIIEGVAQVTVEAAWDKYACFRLHNLTAQPVTVTFANRNGADYTLALAPFGCTTLRRDWQGAGYQNYRAGGNYFFQYEAGDPRSYWFFPTIDQVATTAPYAHYKAIGYGRRAANAMQANHLANAALVFDWTQYFTRKPDNATTFAGWNDDPTVQCDIYPFYRERFGDPAEAKTLVGDLLHHRGEILIVRTARTKHDPVTPANPLVTFDRVSFNGYAAIAADFAKQKLSVTENAAGNLVIDSVDPDNTVVLCPLSTNLLKVGDDIDGNWRLNGYPNVKGVRLPVTIENAIFEAQPEAPGRTNLTLATSGPQLIQQPLATVTTPSQNWYDYYDPANWAGAGNGQITPIVVAGGPQVTLNWDTNARGLLQVPTILDGGSGYAVDDQEQLAGGTGDPAVVVVTAVNQGEVTAIAVSFPGNYSGAPDNPNVPVTIYPVGRQGKGLRLGNISVPLRTLNGIHRLTVADLLKLDWWGDPRAGDQSSNYVVISDRRLRLTPQGLVLTFTETDAALPGDTAGQPASLPTFASGQRGQPRHRAVRFRGHGWGFVGGPADTEAATFYNIAQPTGSTFAVAPSAKSGWLSPRRGRATVAGGYAGDVVAPAGADFTVQSLAAKPSEIQLLTRVPAGALAVTEPWGRFWRAAWVDNAAKFLPQVAASAADFYQWFTVNSGVGGAPAPDLAMTLLPEMYNALARAVNAITLGAPLAWQCLFFKVGGRVLNLDPQYVLNFSGYNYPSGMTQADGTYTGYGYCNQVDRPRPINQFAMFDQGSIYQQLCDQLGLPVQTEKDLPGGLDRETGHGKDLEYFARQYSAPAVYVDFQRAADARIAVQMDGSYTGTIQVDVETELLETTALLQGRATGRHCLGTYDPAQYTAGGLGPGGDGRPPYPDFTHASVGAYYVASDGSGKVASATGEGYVWGGPLVPGQAYWPGGVLDLANDFVGYRWVQIEDVQRLVERLGFPFLWSEVCTPLELNYFADPTEQVVLGGGGQRQPVAGGFNLFSSEPDDVAMALGYIATLHAEALSFSHSGLPGHGTLIKFCVSAEARKALWKCAAAPAPNLGYPATALVADAPVSGRPAEVLNLQSRQRLSPLFRCVGAAGRLGGSIAAWHWDRAEMGAPTPYGTTVGGVYISGALSYLCLGSRGDRTYYLKERLYVAPMIYLPSLALDTPEMPPCTRPSAGPVATLAVQYVPRPGGDLAGLTATYYAEGSLLDQVQSLAINLYSSQPVAPIPVVMSGIMAWRKQTDWWGGLDLAYAASQAGTSAWIPWQFVPPAPTFTQYVTRYFDGAGQNGLTVITAPKPDQRYWCGFSLAAFDLQSVTFSSPENFGSVGTQF